MIQANIVVIDPIYAPKGEEFFIVEEEFETYDEFVEYIEYYKASYGRICSGPFTVLAEGWVV